MYCTRLVGNTGRKNDAKKSPFAHHRTILSGWVFATKAYIDNRKKFIKQQYALLMFPQYGELRLSSGWERFGSLGHHCKFQRLSRFGSVSAHHSGSRPLRASAKLCGVEQRRHLYSVGRPSRWALSLIHIWRCRRSYACRSRWSPYH